MKKEITRCHWAHDNPLLIEYHDKEWGVPVADDRLLFEFLILEGVQAGLSWLTVLKKRDAYRQNFDRFNPKLIANYNKTKINKLIKDASIIRNRAKINAAVINAQMYLEVKKEWQSFSHYLWHFVDGKPIRNQRKNRQSVPATSDVSDRISKELKKKGFKFVGSTICYAFMQAVGMVNDHTIDCFRHKQIDSLMKKWSI